MKKDHEYKVGYRKPPIHTRFKPGQTGNRAGRLKEKLSDLDEVLKGLNKKKKLADGRGLSKFEIGIEQLRAKALRGNLEASALLIQVIQVIETIPSAAPIIVDLFESDRGHGVKGVHYD